MKGFFSDPFSDFMLNILLSCSHSSGIRENSSAGSCWLEPSSAATISGLKETVLFIPQRTSEPSCLTQLVGFGRHYQRKQTLIEAVTPKIDRFLPPCTHTHTHKHAVWPPMLAPIMRDMFTQSGANRPLLTPHLGLSSETTIYSAPSCSSGGGTLGISQGSDISDASPPSLCSTAQCWQRDALLKKHYTRALSTVSAWGGNEKTFSSWFQEYKQILASLNLLLSQTFILLRDVGEKDRRSQGNRYFAD